MMATWICSCGHLLFVSISGGEGPAGSPLRGGDGMNDLGDPFDVMNECDINFDIFTAGRYAFTGVFFVSRAWLKRSRIPLPLLNLNFSDRLKP